MRLLERHIQYLVRRHECVVVPGLGAFLCQYHSARFDDSCNVILPPGKKLAFNRWLSEDDGLLSHSVARANGVSVSEATNLIREEVEDIQDRLSAGESIEFGKLGTFKADLSSKEIDFIPTSNLSGINSPLFGLLPLQLSPLQDTGYSSSSVESQSVGAGLTPGDNSGKRRLVWFPPQWRAYASGIVASLAVFLTLLFFIMSPIRVDTNTQSASIAPISSVAQESAISSDTVSDSSPAIVDEAPDSVYYEPAESSCEAASDGLESISDEISDSVSDESAEFGIDIVTDKSADSQIRFSAGDPYIVVIASFPSLSLAESFMNDKSNMHLGVEHMDGRYRVYAATGNNYSTAMKMMELVGQQDAWICRK
ncbi:MAG: HU family DNA-binding protein [Bacteroidales bacterium]|nr:HU family DNA-binding protein [Bacteroidales bacterium]